MSARRWTVTVSWPAGAGKFVLDTEAVDAASAIGNALDKLTDEGRAEVSKVVAEEQL